MNCSLNVTSGAWVETALIRTAFIFIVLLTIPLSGSYYQQLFNTNWFNFREVFQLINYVPRFFSPYTWGIASFSGWGIALIIAIFVALIWTQFYKNSKYATAELYYWLRVGVRYRLALALLSYGAIKIFPIQLPGPTLSDLHTAYGDFLPWKLYYLSTGVATAYYEQSLGAIEFLAGILLLFRRTTVIGAGLATALLINIVLANFAYQLGDHLYSVYLLILSVFLLLYDVPRLYQLLVLERAAKADDFEPSLRFRFKPLFQILTGLFILFFSSITYASYKNSQAVSFYPAGIKDAAGVYNVEDFYYKNQQIPYSTTDSLRWTDVVFEKWNVLSLRRNVQAPLNPTSPGLIDGSPAFYDYQAEGNSGRFFYTYTVKDSLMSLVNKNNPADRLTFHLSRPEPNQIRLKGINSQGDSLLINLKKENKEYLLDKGRRKKVSVY